MDPRRKRREENNNKEKPPEKYSIEWYMLEAERRKNMTDRAVAADAQPAPVMPAAVGAGAALVGTCALLLARAVSDVPPS